jgi:hypothetical protein
MGNQKIMDGQGTLMGIDELIENYPIAIVHQGKRI